MIRLTGFQRLVLSIFLFALGDAASHVNAQTYLVRSGDYWTYWDFGFEPDPDWASQYYEDYDWALGPSALGFGEPYIATEIGQGIMTAYFRNYFFLDAVPT